MSDDAIEAARSYRKRREVVITDEYRATMSRRARTSLFKRCIGEALEAQPMTAWVEAILLAAHGRLLDWHRDFGRSRWSCRFRIGGDGSEPCHDTAATEEELARQVADAVLGVVNRASLDAQYVQAQVATLAARMPR